VVAAEFAARARPQNENEIVNGHFVSVGRRCDAGVDSPPQQGHASVASTVTSLA
jgi:hypothetical protein